MMHWHCTNFLDPALNASVTNGYISCRPCFPTAKHLSNKIDLRLNSSYIIQACNQALALENFIVVIESCQTYNEDWILVVWSPGSPLFNCFYRLYSIQPKYSNRHASANGVDPDQTAPKEQFDLGLYCLPFSLYTHQVHVVKQTSSDVHILGPAWLISGTQIFGVIVVHKLYLVKKSCIACVDSDLHICDWVLSYCLIVSFLLFSHSFVFLHPSCHPP